MAEHNFRNHPEVLYSPFSSAGATITRRRFTAFAVTSRMLRRNTPLRSTASRAGAQVAAIKSRCRLTRTRASCCGTSTARGQRTSLKKFRGASDDFGRAAEFSQGEYRVNLLVMSAKALADAGEPIQAAEQADKALNSPQVSTESRLLAARVFSLAAKASKDRKDAEAYAKRAVGELVKVEASGGFRDPESKEVLDDADFASLRGRGDFEAVRTSAMRR